MVNQRLRGALLNAELTPAALADLVEVDIKSVHRWLAEERVPYPSTRHKVAHALDQQETFLWPELLDGVNTRSAGAAEIDRIWPTRSTISSETWHSLFSRATKEIDILVYAGAFLMETLDLVEVLRWKASAGTHVRILVGDPSSPAVQMRATELNLTWLSDRCASTARYLEAVRGIDNIEVGLHGTTLYASHFRFDDRLLLNISAFGVWACHSPVLQVPRSSMGRLFSFHAEAFSRAWQASASASAQ